MVNLISRDDAIAVAMHSKDPVDGIKHLPAVDAAEVVRCKDCKHYSFISLACMHDNFNGIIGMNGFCSYAERKE